MGSLHSELPEENPSATAVQFFPRLVRGTYTVAVGLETGDMLIWKLNAVSMSWSKVYQVPDYFCHCAAVRRIKFNAETVEDEGNSFIVATGANDHSVRVFRINL